MKHSLDTLKRAIVAELSPDLLKPKYRRRKKRNRFTGHCYVATEALYHLCGAQSSGLAPQVLRHAGGTHWYLKELETGRIIDLTARQFKTAPRYENGRGCGFMGKDPSVPSLRCRILIARVKVRLALISRSRKGKST